jgi:hypothetical protein
MNKDLHFTENIASGQEITTKERGHSLSNVVFLFPGVSFFIGFLSYLFPCLIISRLIQRGGQSTDCLKKWLCSDLTVIIGLAEKNKQMLKTVKIVC